MAECLCPGCSEPVPASLLACRPHWRALPPDLRGDINAAYQRHARKEHRDLMRAAIQVWQAQEEESA